MRLRVFAWSVGFGALVAAGAACSLLYPPSEYFDPAEQLSVFADAPGGALAIVLTTSDVVYLAGYGVFTIPKSGGPAVTLQKTSSYGSIAALASNGDDLVAWCGNEGVAAWGKDHVVVPIDGSVTDCTSIAVNGSTVAVATEAGDGTSQINVYRGSPLVLDTSASRTVPALMVGTSPALVALRSDDRVYVATNVAIARTADAGVVGFCPLALTGAVPRAFDLAETDDAGGILWLYFGALFSAVGSIDTCCDLRDAGCSRPPGLPSQTWSGATFAKGYLYVLDGTALRRVPIASATTESGDPDAGVLRGGLSGLVGSLAADDSYAYFGVSERIERVALPH